jgi:hypothetical protein
MTDLFLCYWQGCSNCTGCAASHVQWKLLQMLTYENLEGREFKQLEGTNILFAKSFGMIYIY